MKASEALMLGSTLLKPVQGKTVAWSGTNFNDGSEPDGGCAIGMIGAALVGVRNLIASDAIKALPAWMNLERVALPCQCQLQVPGFMRTSQTVTSIVMHLFDFHVCNDHGWTLEKIATWLDTVEPAANEVVKREPVDVCGLQFYAPPNVDAEIEVVY